MFAIAAIMVGLTVAGAGPADTMPHPVWTLSTTTAAVDDTISAWLALTIAPKQRVVSELESTAALKTWFAGDSSVDGCRRGSFLSTHRDSVSTVLHVCALAQRAGTIRLVALVRSETDPKAAAVRAVGSEAIAIKPTWNIDLPAWAIALLTSISGFLAGLLLQGFQQRRQRADKLDDEARERLEAKEAHRRETEQTLTKALAPDIAVNVQRLRDVIAGKPPQVLLADASALFTEKQRGLFAYLGADASQALDDLAYLYTAIAAYNRIRSTLIEERTAGVTTPARQQHLVEGMRKQAPTLLEMIENPHQDAKGKSATIVQIASEHLRTP
ncbi:MAG: hypothetical protein ABI664_03775 [bacterium]